jgi:4'-phosphopantetheinyl transferase
MAMSARTSAPPTLSVPTDGVHVWYASLDRPAAQVKRFRQMLTPAEQDRANHFHFKCDRSRWIVARGLLRTILARYLSVEPREIRFVYGASGKPALATEHGDTSLTFNLSHADDLAAYAIGRAPEIGIDVERIRPVPELEQIAEGFFSLGERAALMALPASERTIGFFNCWTRKEAYVKATGDGLAHPLDRFDVSLAPDEPATLLHVDGAPWQASEWSLAAFMPAPDVRGALAVRGTTQTVTYRWWLE